MSDDNEDSLWPELGLSDAVRFDAEAQLRNQAEKLASQTNNIVLAAVSTQKLAAPSLHPRPPKSSIPNLVRLNLMDELRNRERSPLTVVTSIAKTLKGGGSSDLDVNVYHHCFDIVVPVLEFSLTLFAAEQCLNPFPVVFSSEPLKAYKVAEGPEDFQTILRGFLADRHTQLLIRTLHSQATESFLEG